MRQDKEKDLEGADLAYAGGRLRLFVEARLSEGAMITPNDAQAHYLLHVMRARAGEYVLLFNGVDGEWRAQITDVSRRACRLLCDIQTEPQIETPVLWFAFAPIKKTPADYVVQKATELGASVLQPVITNRTIARRVNLDRLRANAVESSEQSGRLSVPDIREPLSLEAFLKSWPQDSQLIFCDEGGDCAAIADVLSKADAKGGLGVLVGPEGGFDAGERKAIRQFAFVIPVSLGPRILRADTAGLAALSLVQGLIGDWRQE